jgi:hypothetical protein
MAKREVKQQLMSYRDTDGVWRHALQGESVDVASDDLERFDEANGGAPEGSAPAKKAAPKTTRK